MPRRTTRTTNKRKQQMDASVSSPNSTGGVRHLHPFLHYSPSIGFKEEIKK
jgi:hypothetical protein